MAFVPLQRLFLLSLLRLLSPLLSVVVPGALGWVTRFTLRVEVLWSASPLGSTASGELMRTGRHTIVVL